MPFFRKKPVVVEAMQFTQESASKVHSWIVFNGGKVSSSTDGISILTREGPMLVKERAWVIRGVEGEFYPCDERIFQKTYEAIDPTEEKAQREAQKEAHAERMKTALVINRFDSKCGACGGGANPNEEAHVTQLAGYTGRQTSRGCGVVWQYVTSDYIEGEEWCRRMKPDLEFFR
jgi:hypothetical protein